MNINGNYSNTSNNVSGDGTGGGGGSGDVSSVETSSVDTQIVIMNGTTGKSVKKSNIIIQSDNQVNNISRIDLPIGSNIRIGRDSGGPLANTSAANISLGYGSGTNLNNGALNILIGDTAGPDLVSGARNISIGQNSGRYISVGSGNTFVGDNTYASNFFGGVPNIQNGVVLGASSKISGNNAIAIGHSVESTNGVSTNECCIGNASITSIYNQGNNTCDLGKTTKQLKNIYISGDIIKNGTVFAGAGGDVVGPSTSVDNTIPKYDGVTGKLIQSSGVVITDFNNVSGIGSLTASNAIRTNNLYSINQDVGIGITDTTVGDITLTGTAYNATQNNKILSIVGGKIIPIVNEVGDVVSGNTSVDNTIPKYDGVTGKLIQSSGVEISDFNNMTGIGSLTASNAIRTNNLYSINQDVGLSVTDTTVGDITLTGTAYNAAQNGKILSLANGKLIPIENKVGDVAGPSTSVDNTIPKYDGTTGKLIQSSGVEISDFNNMTGIGSLTASNAIRTNNLYSINQDVGVSITDTTVGDITLTGTAYNAAQNGKILSIVGGKMTPIENKVGDVVGPSTSTDLTIPRYDSTTGKLLKSSGVVIDDANNIYSTGLTATTLASTTGNIGTLTSNSVLSNKYFNNSDTAGLLLDNAVSGNVKLSYTQYLTATDDSIMVCMNGGTVRVPSNEARIDPSGNLNARGMLATGGNIEVIANNKFIGETLQLKNVGSGPLKLYNNNSVGMEIINDGTGSLKLTGSAYTGATGQYLQINAADGTIRAGPADADAINNHMTGPFTSTDNAIVRFNGIGGKLAQNSVVRIQDSGSFLGVGTVNCTGIACSATVAGATIKSNTWNTAGQTIGIALADTTAGDLTLTGSSYVGLGTDKYLKLDNTGKVVPATVSGGSSSSSANYSDFRIKQTGTETISYVYANKTNEFVTIQLNTLTINTPSTGGQILSYLTNITALHPLEPNAQLIIVNDKAVIVNWVFNTPNWYLSINSVDAWPTTSIIKSFTFTYRSTNSTSLTSGVWGTAYPVAPEPSLTSPHNLTANNSNPNFITSASSQFDTIYAGWAAFDGSGTPWASIGGTYTTGSGNATATDTFNPGTGNINGSWQKVALDQIYKFNRYRVWFASGTSAPVDWTLYGSSDDSTYTAINSQTAFTITNSGGYEPAINIGTQTYRYIVFHVTKTGGGNQTDVPELDYYWQ